MKTGHESYPNDPYGNYSFYPYGPGNLINVCINKEIKSFIQIINHKELLFSQIV